MINTILLALALLPAAPMPAARPERIHAPHENQDDLTRFPELVCADANVTFADAHLVWLDAWIETHPREAHRLTAWRQETLALRAQWLWLARLHCGCEGDGWLVPSYRQALRDSLGEEAWQAGRMPPCVPIWRFGKMH